MAEVLPVVDASTDPRSIIPLGQLALVPIRQRSRFTRSAWLASSQPHVEGHGLWQTRMV